MFGPGFLGTRADALIDTTIVIFAVMPFLLIYSVSLAKRRQHRCHRNLQVAALALMFAAVLALELDIRFGDVMEAARRSSMANSPWLVGTFIVHLSVALPSFVSWILLEVKSWRRFMRQLPGPFSGRHIILGKTTFAGVCLTSLTGAGLYWMVFAS